MVDLYLTWHHGESIFAFSRRSTCRPVGPTISYYHLNGDPYNIIDYGTFESFDEFGNY